MIAGQKDYRLAHSILMGVVGLAMLGWAIPYGIANYKLDRCNQEFQIKLATFKSEIAKTQTAIEGARKALEQK